jgi:PAS domain S-box-containing protein
MPLQESPYLILGIVNAALALGAALWILQRRPVRGARTFAVIVLCLAGWSATHTFSYLALSLQGKLFWSQMSFLPAVVAPAAGLIFCLRFGDPESHITSRHLALLAIMPALTLLLVWTNEWHGWIWQTVGLDPAGALRPLLVTHGPWFWLHVGYSFVLAAISVLLLLSRLRIATGLQRRQALGLLFAALVSWLANIVSVAVPDEGPLPAIVGAGVTGILVIWTVLRLRLFDLVPIACNTVVQQMDASVIVVDVYNRILHLNPAAEGLIGRSAGELIGQYIGDVIPGYPLRDRFGDQTGNREELVFGVGEARRFYDLHISPLRDPEGGLAGRLVTLYDITQRRELESDIRARRLYLQRVLDCAPDAIVAVNGQRRVVEWNRGAETLFGYSAEEARERDLDRLISGSNAQTYQEAVALTERALSGQIVPPTEVMRHGKNGHPVHAIVAGSPLILGEEVIGIVGVYTDLSQLREAEEALRQSEARYRAIVQDQTELISRFRPDGVLTFVNEAACHYLGFSEQQLLGQDLIPFVPDEDQERVREALAGLTAERPVVTTENRVITADGAERWVQWTNRAVCDEQGQVTEIQSVGRDITESKRAQDALREAESTYRSLVDTSPDGIMLSNLEGKTILSNRQAALLCGYGRPEEMIGLSMFELIDPQDRERAWADLRQVLASGSVQNKQYMLVRKDGSRFPAEISSSVVRDADLEPVRFIGIIRDVTMRKRAEAQLQASLRQKETLLKEIHHRVKDNLQVVSSLLYVQALQARDPATRRVLEDSRSRVHSMALAHEKLYGSPDLSRIDLAEYVQGLVSSLLQAHAVDVDRIEVQVQFQSKALPLALAMPCGLIINELVSNALQHAFVNRARGQVRVQMSAEDGRYRLQVSDDGVGLPPDVDLQEPGSFGLQLVKMLVDQLHGTMSVDSGEGTCFRIQFAAEGDWAEAEPGT